METTCKNIVQHAAAKVKRPREAIEADRAEIRRQLREAIRERDALTERIHSLVFTESNLCYELDGDKDWRS